jgi:acetylglutamate/LysW-gamma-L-alpha-aminoadipate kinase
MSTVVVKIGGATIDAADQFAAELADMREDHKMIIVHGGADYTSALCQRMGHPVRMITSPSGMVSRYTDSETLDIFAMALAGQINTRLVALLRARGVNALGLAGVDGGLLRARRKSTIRAMTPDGRVYIIRDDFTGHIKQVNWSLLLLLLEAGYTPVVAPLALSDEFERVNVDADRVAAAIAAACKAEELIILTNVPGLMLDLKRPETLVRSIPSAEVAHYAQYAHAGMKKKLLGAKEALDGGVSRVCLGSRSVHAVRSGSGTIIESSAASPA